MMFTPTALMKPTITELGTNRSSLPRRRSPATSITTPVTTDSVNRALAGSSRPAKSTSATSSDIAPVACTAMKGVLVSAAAPTIPNR